ncbi:spore cortex-lytic enzyme [Brevibacillus composti]|uniref:Spore cortex-lytic enzyme n=1 Tax=Brevibacillus composti TaxID=2796470 RepID=A0A7T5JME9_9BACL|nr:spore cortex-lytic enzyme [Brevibacillus composti]QQE72946.1 spore cortex-lytic enzyme [Brevibacillus composti]QUO40024.1 spore cortex-lytic enzyme [Brevibacillus composti]
MNRPVKWLLALLAIVLLFTASVMIYPVRTDAFSKEEVRVGASGKDVREMQGRLKYLGFYTGKVDGQFSWRTYWALRNFQYEFGLKVDGILGPKTKLKLYNATTGYRPTAEELGVAPAPAPAPAAPRNKTYRSKGISENDLRLMANAVHGEARGEPYVGQVAVAAVILNRTRNPAFPNTPAGVIFEPRAFTAVADGQIWLTPNDTSRKAVRDALSGWDPTGGAIYYFNPDTATSAWIWTRPQIKRIGKHIFCR